MSDEALFYDRYARPFPGSVAEDPVLVELRELRAEVAGLREDVKRLTAGGGS